MRIVYSEIKDRVFSTKDDFWRMIVYFQSRSFYISSNNFDDTLEQDRSRYMIVFRGKKIHDLINF